MNKVLIVITLCFACIIQKSYAQQAKIIKLPYLLQRIQAPSDTVYVVNFWATWCAPCVMEMPELLKVHQQYKNKAFRLLLVSLDFKKDLGKLNTFIKTKNIDAEVLLMDETKYNDWIDKINKDWGGSIPATLMVKNTSNYKNFIEKSITFQELADIIEPLLK